MRVRLKPNYQNKLILKAKTNNNLTWKELSSRLNLCEGYLKNELRNEKTTLSEKIYFQLTKLAKVNFDKQIIKKLDDNWGRLKGSLTFEKPKLLINKPSKKLAELIGIILGDGNIWTKKGFHYIRICGDCEKDKEYLSNYAKPLFENLFKTKMQIYCQKDKNVMYISKGSRDVVFTLNKFGLKSGNKKQNNQGIPKWIFKDKEYLKACIRGLIDTDGCLCPITGRDYNYIWFSCGIKKLREDFQKAMGLLGFKISKWNIREGRTPDTYIGKKELIKKYIQTISFKNQRHLHKICTTCPDSTEAKPCCGVKSTQGAMYAALSRQ